MSTYFDTRRDLLTELPRLGAKTTDPETLIDRVLRFQSPPTNEEGYHLCRWIQAEGRQYAEIAHTLVTLRDLRGPAWLGECVHLFWEALGGPEDSLTASEWSELFRSAGFRWDGEPSQITQVPTLYRGATADRKLRMPWTNSLATARRYASSRRGSETGFVWQAQFSTVDVLAVIDFKPHLSRWGVRIHEYIIDPEAVERAELAAVETIHDAA